MVRSLLFCVMLLTLLVACSRPATVQVPVTVPVSVPVELQACPKLPTVPDQGASQAGVADYIVQLHSVAVTCKVRLNAVVSIVTKASVTKAP
jgi:hypothetical protein